MNSEYTAIEQAKLASVAWLQCIDQNENADSWAKAASVFQHAITQADWVKEVEAVRVEFGECLVHNHHSAIFTQDLANAPTGAYVVIQYQSDFARQVNVTEVVTCFKEIDGSWKVAGYFLR
ncbi:MAG: hypothetical protein H6R05_11 [Burkholderiaceae bacterium]|nr:hypothetical protein [Burkholderiaceae bacterium]